MFYNVLKTRSHAIHFTIWPVDKNAGKLLFGCQWFQARWLVERACVSVSDTGFTLMEAKTFVANKLFGLLSVLSQRVAMVAIVIIAFFTSTFNFSSEWFNVTPCSSGWVGFKYPARFQIFQRFLFQGVPSRKTHLDWGWRIWFFFRDFFKFSGGGSA